MSIMIGFGSTEERVEEEVLDRIRRGDSPKDIEKEYNETADINDKLDRSKAKDRYSRITIFDWGCHHLEVSFHHVNRQHALSPDGWAGMLTERLVKKAEGSK
ncbi:hypothetical protein LCGC14_1377120 [marine sediment metagenome]|uniref:Uncharacterized protein n=1 Tax=marine sediment metagenome TaxID=412755 RepID=A0A0F9KPN0_9ZZZZ